METSRRQAGNVLILALMLVFLLVALSSAQFMIVQKNSRQSVYITTHDMLRSYADSGAFLALHDLRYSVTPNGGKIGTGAWTVLNDVGKDGQAATFDEGEGDGLPTIGEPNLAAVSIGPADLGASLFVYVEDSGWSNVKRIISTAFNGDSMATVETFAKRATTRVPRTSAVYIEPSVVLDLRGNRFSITGVDTNPDGTPGPDPATYGIATSPGDPPGSNASALIDQIPPLLGDQITGLGATPSVGESSITVDINELFESFKAKKDQELNGAHYMAAVWGSESAPLITYASGDIMLSGTSSGAGILLVDGSLTFSGQFTFAGVVIVRGDVRLTGGGTTVHTYGAVMVTQSLTMVDESELTFWGNADAYYSSAAIGMVEDLLDSKENVYTVLYWNHLK